MDAIKKKALELMKRWCDKLMEYEVRAKDPVIDGALLCPACHVAHGRSADLVLPLITLYKEYRDEKYLEFAKRSIDFTESSLVRVDGGYNNDLGNRWFGTTAFSAIAIGETLLQSKDVIPERLYDEWMKIFIRLSEFCYNSFDHFNPVINYRAGAAAIFALSHVITGDEKYRIKANEWESYCRRHFDEDGLFFGEIIPHDYISQKGCRGIDMGYDLEESIPLLLMHAHYSADKEKIAFYKARMLDHLEFLLPDGGIDNSFGTRHNKWTYWGSRTSDGVIAGLALALDEPIFRKAAERVLELYERCTYSDLLALPMAKDADERICLHHTFCHVKALAALVNADREDISYPPKTVLPREKEYGIKLFQNGNLALLAKDGFRATVSAIGICKYNGAENYGGSLGLLWNEKYGPICAATMNSYDRSEPLNMQIPIKSLAVECMTPRLIIGGESSDKDASVLLTADNGSIKASADKWRAEYSARDGEFRIEIHTDEKAEYILPIIAPASAVATFGDKVLEIDSSLTVSSSLPITADTSRRYFNPVGGFNYIKLSFSVESELTIGIKVK